MNLMFFGQANGGGVEMLHSFMFGAVCYPALELLWRRRTHWSMALAGGFGSALIFAVSRLRSGYIPKALLCTSGITCIEYAAGLIFNQKYDVWDYRRMPLNIRGQICVPYMVLWYGLSTCMLFAIEISKKITDSQ